MNSHCFSINQIKSWLATCNHGHAGLCHSVSDPWRKLNTHLTLILIDVEENCLVEQTQRCDYIALSYVWGHGSQPFQITQENIATLRETGAFAMEENYIRLPRTIKDSMLRTRRIGVRYLWVDRFCIVQDDYRHKYTQINFMASIYANAYCTIVAANGNNNNSGLPGIDPNAHPRAAPHLISDFTESCSAVTPTLLGSRSAYYHSRAWTYQE